MPNDDDFRFIAIEAYADMRSYVGMPGHAKLAREAQMHCEAMKRMIAERQARGEIYAPHYVIDYAANERFWRDHFAQAVWPSRIGRAA